VKENEKALVLDVLDKKVKELDQESEERKEEKQPRREPKEPRADGYKGGDRVYKSVSSRFLPRRGTTETATTRRICFLP